VKLRNWWVVLLAAGLVVLGVELLGVFNHGAHEVDTYSELYWWVRDAVGWWLVVPLTAGLGWLWWHLTYGRRRG